MTIHEFGDPSKPVILLLPGTMCYCTVEQLKQDNCRIIDGFKSYGEQITLITENYDDSIKGVLY